MNKTEILHYLRTSSRVNDEQLMRLIDDAMVLVNETVSPKSIYRIFDCEVTDNSLIIGDFEFRSRRLAENLRGCRSVAILAATAGTEGDRLLRAASGEGAELAIMQAVLSSKIEEICDSVQKKIEADNGVKTRQRYSAGYFDLDITEQKKIFQLMEITKRCGISLTVSCQMLPTKSVTAFTGIDYEN